MSAPSHRYNTRSAHKARHNEAHKALQTLFSATRETSSETPLKQETSRKLGPGCICEKCTDKPLGPPPGFEHVIPKKIEESPKEAPTPTTPTTPTTPNIVKMPTMSPTKYYGEATPLGFDVNQTLAYQVRQSNIYIDYELNACKKTKGVNNKKAHITNIFNHLLANHAILILYPKFRKIVLNKIDEIAADCKKHAEEIKQKELEEELNNLETKIVDRLINSDYKYRVKGYINDIKNIIDMTHKELEYDTLPELCGALRNLIKDNICAHPNYVAY